MEGEDDAMARAGGGGGAKPRGALAGTFESVLGAGRSAVLASHLEAFSKSVTAGLPPGLYSVVLREKASDVLQALKGSKLLRSRVEDGSVQVEQLCNLLPRDLFPEKWEALVRRKELLEKKEENLSVTDVYQCSVCKQSKCSVTQVQTRSADEPMTTLIKCLECGHCTTEN